MEEKIQKSFTWYLKNSFLVLSLVTIPLFLFFSLIVLAFGQGDGFVVLPHVWFFLWLSVVGVLTPVLAFLWRTMFRLRAKIKIERWEKVLLAVLVSVVLLPGFRTVWKSTQATPIRNFCNSYKRGSPFSAEAMVNRVASEQLGALSLTQFEVTEIGLNHNTYRALEGSGKQLDPLNHRSMAKSIDQAGANGQASLGPMRRAHCLLEFSQGKIDSVNFYDQ